MVLIFFLSGLALLVLAAFADEFNIGEEGRVPLIVFGVLIASASLLGFVIIEVTKHNINNYGECITKLKDEKPADRKLLCEKYKMEKE